MAPSAQQTELELQKYLPVDVAPPITMGRMGGDVGKSELMSSESGLISDITERSK